LHSNSSWHSDLIGAAGIDERVLMYERGLHVMYWSCGRNSSVCGRNSSACVGNSLVMLGGVQIHLGAPTCSSAAHSSDLRLRLKQANQASWQGIYSGSLHGVEVVKDYFGHFGLRAGGH
jgi:hypothetical protein